MCMCLGGYARTMHESVGAESSSMITVIKIFLFSILRSKLLVS